jgi:hypothetical protein
VLGSRPSCMPESPCVPTSPLPSCLCLSLHAHANLLTNGGAEMGTLAGWTVGGVSNPGVDNGSFDKGINPHAGNFAFFGGTGAWGTLTQNVALDGFGQSRRLGVSFWERGLDQGTPSDDGFVTLTYYGGDGSVVGTQSSSVVDAHLSDWKQYKGAFIVPLEAISVDYTMHFTRNFGADLDAFFDNNSLTLTTDVPEPSTGWLTFAGLGIMGALLRRRAR